MIVIAGPPSYVVGETTLVAALVPIPIAVPVD